MSSIRGWPAALAVLPPALAVLPAALAVLACVSACSNAEGTASGGGTVRVTISGEALATAGLPFPGGSGPVISDGWEIHFTHVLVTVDDVTLSTDPDRAPSDQSETGSVVARARGPWAVDLHVEGPEIGEGGEGTATPLVTLRSQNENGDAPFAADERYAFGYRSVPASDAARKVNFAGDAEARAIYAHMVVAGYSVLYAGTATFNGRDCTTTSDDYDFSLMPKTVAFEIGFNAQTAYVNCQNQQNQGDPFSDEEYQRGVAVPSNAPATAQITFHLDHAFFADVHHDPSLFFGQIGARAVGKPDGAVVTMDDLIGVDPTAFTDGAGAKLPFRICDGSPVPRTPQMGFQVGSVPVDRSAAPGEALRDYRDYMTYVTSTQGHLNGGEGLCFVKRGFPSPP